MSGIDNTPEWADILTALTDRDAVMTALRMFAAERQAAANDAAFVIVEERDAAREKAKALAEHNCAVAASVIDAAGVDKMLTVDLGNPARYVRDLRQERDALRARVAEMEAEPRRDDNTDFTRLMDHIRRRMQSQAASAGAFTSRGDQANALRSLHQSDALWFVMREWDKDSSTRCLGASDTPAAVAVKAAKEAANADD